MHYRIYSLFVVSSIWVNIASGQPSNRPRGEPDNCVILSAPGFEPASGSHTVEWSKNGIHSYKATVEWTPPPLSHGFYSEKGWLVGEQDRKSFNATGYTPSPPKEYTAHCGQSVTAWSDNFTAMYRDPCAEQGAVGPPLAGGTWSSGDTTIKAPDCSEPDEVDPTIPDDPENTEGQIKDPYEEGQSVPQVSNTPFVPGICEPVNHPDTRKPASLPACHEVELVSESIGYWRRKIGFRAYNYDPDSSSVPEYYIQEMGRSSLFWKDGNRVANSQGSWTARHCKSGGLILLEQTGTYWSGPRKRPGVTLTETTASGSMPIFLRSPGSSYHGDLGDLTEAIMHFATSLSDNYTTEMLVDDTIEYMWDFKGDGYYKIEGPLATYRITATEEECSIHKTKYKIRVPSDVPKPYKAFWVEEFTPKDTNPNDDQKPEKTYTVKSEKINGQESSVYTIDPTKTPKKEGSWRVSLLPMEFEYFKPDTNSDQQWQDPSYKMPWSSLYTFDAIKNHSLKFKVKAGGLISTPAMLDLIEIEVARHSGDPAHPPTWVKYKLGEIGRISADKKEVWCTISAADMISKVKIPPVDSAIRNASLDWISDPAKSSFSDSNFVDD